MDQLHKTPAHISMLELLRLSPSHKSILDKALAEASIPMNITEEQFQTMVGHITSPHSLSFTEKDDMSITQPHNTSLHIEAFIHKHKIKRVLINGGVGLNICTLKLILTLGFLEKAIDLKRKIMIKAYDEEERTSKGIVTLPIRVGPVVKDVACQVLDMELAYNILLGQPWIHALKAVPSTCHQCIKFPHEGQEITIQGDPNPYQYCNSIQPKPEVVIPNNRASASSSSQVDLATLASSSRAPQPKLQLKDKGLGEYTVSQSLYLAQLSLFPRSYGRPILKTLAIEKPTKGPFVKWGNLEDESDEKDILQWLYKDEASSSMQHNHPTIPTEQYGQGFQMLQRMGYEGHGPLSSRKDGITEPIQSHTLTARDTTGLGYTGAPRNN